MCRLWGTRLCSGFYKQSCFLNNVFVHPGLYHHFSQFHSFPWTLRGVLDEKAAKKGWSLKSVMLSYRAVFCIHKQPLGTVGGSGSHRQLLPEPHIFTRSKCTQQCPGAWVERLSQQLWDHRKVLGVSLFHVSSPLVNKITHPRLWVGQRHKHLWSTTVCLCECNKECSMCLCVFARVVMLMWNCQILPVMNASSYIPKFFCFSFHAFSSKLFLSFCGKCNID